MKIKISDVNKMIKEEFERTSAKKKLSSRLSKINEELKNMNSEDSILNEVETGKKTTVSSNAWTGDGDVKWIPEFQKKGSSLMEDNEEEENEMDIDEPEMGGEIEITAHETGEEDIEVEMGEFETKFAEIGRAIDAKMGAEIEAGMAPEIGGDHEKDEPEVEIGDEDFEEVEVSDDNQESEKSDDTEEVEEVEEDEEDEEDEEIKETVYESVKKDKNKKGVVITEVKKPAAKNIFTEGLDANKKTALLKEFNRMKKFAGLSKDEE